MKNWLLLSLVALSPVSQAAEKSYIGHWIDTDLATSFAEFESKADLKAFCANAYYQGDSIDQVFEISAENKLLSCKLNKDQSLPMGANCDQAGVVTGNSVTITYVDGTASGDIAEKEADHIEVSIKHPAQGGVAPVEVWDIRRLSDSRVAALAKAFQRCIAGN